MELLLENQYLNLPVKNGAPQQRVQFLIAGQIEREFEIELADDAPDFWVILDIRPFHGKTATLTVEGQDTDPKGFSLIHQGDTITGAENLYQESLRPQFHFSSRRGWNNDPNGLVYYEGEYHLYYQHNPYGWKWGNMHWGHAISQDLVHWQELPIALYPVRFGDWCFSGSAVVDGDNTAGFKTGDDDVIVAAYTSTGRGESIAYSNDRGRTFTEFEGNPVVEHAGRDPKLIWYAPGSHWVMAVYDELEDSRGIAFYTSPDLKQWKRTSRIKDYFECPEIFKLPVDGDPEVQKWVVYGADGSYAIGDFDGKAFTAESGKHRFHYGNSFYASQTWSDLPPEDGRRIQIAWGRSETPGMPFNQMMLFPVELTLHTTDAGIRMFAEPVEELEQIRENTSTWQNKAIQPGTNLLEAVEGELFDIRAEFEVGDAAAFGFVIRGVPVVYDVQEQQLSCAGCAGPLAAQDGVVRLQILVDRTSIEIFGNGGQFYMPVSVTPEVGNRTLEIFSKEGMTTVKHLDVAALASIW